MSSFSISGDEVLYDPDPEDFTADLQSLEEADLDDAMKDFAKRFVDNVRERIGDSEEDSFVDDDGALHRHGSSDDGPGPDINFD